jgi:hypothetical protein
MYNLIVRDDNFIEKKFPELNFDYFIKTKINSRDETINVDFIRYFKNDNFEIIIFDVEKEILGDYVLSKIKIGLGIIDSLKFNFKKKLLVGICNGKIDKNIQKRIDVLFDTTYSLSARNILDINFYNFFHLRGKDKFKLVNEFLIVLYKCYYLTQNNIFLEIFDSHIRNVVEKFIIINEKEYQKIIDKNPEKFIDYYGFDECFDFCHKFLNVSKRAFINYVLNDLILIKVK